MASLRFILSVFCLCSTLLICFCLTAIATEDHKKVYIVYMGALPSKSDYSPMSHHQNILQEIIGINSVGDSLIRSYGRSFNGFVARLTEAEREKLTGMERVVSVFPSRDLRLQTTRSWDFMGFGDKFKCHPEVESNTIIGVIDSGIWPESQSFTDEGFGPPPKKWKGACKGGSNFTCNNKLIGARYYVNTSSTARDLMGHGTHTASTAAGNKVKGANMYGLAQGTVRGGVPLARIAAYKVCETATCRNEDILAGFDDAIADNVDVLTVSLGMDSAVPFEEDIISIGAFHAMEKGILTVNSAGNDGPSPRTLTSLSPWVLTVAASSTDRKLVTKVVLGNGKMLLGRSINVFKLNGTKFPLVYGKTASGSCSEKRAKGCYSDCLDRNLIKGKILVCDRLLNVVKDKVAGAVGVILHGDVDDPEVYSVPVSVLGHIEFESLLAYMNSTEEPEGTILKSERVKDTKAPVVVSFSSRGPNSILSDILKPDVTAPGVNILAAYPPFSPLSPFEEDKHVKYTLLSGSSMSCPHAAGVAAYIKTVHPNWSSSMIQSAIMTTAWSMNASSNKEAEFAYGSGHINPTKAADPGLVYEATKDDYLKLLCALNYTAENLRTIAGDNSTCPQGSEKKTKVRDLNYPSMAAKVSSSSKCSKISFSRTVTNVGPPNSTYKAKVFTGHKLRIKVMPEALSFKSLGEKKSFTVTISSSSFKDVVPMESASLVWSDSSHSVRSPIVIYS